MKVLSILLHNQNDSMSNISEKLCNQLEINKEMVSKTMINLFNDNYHISLWEPSINVYYSMDASEQIIENVNNVCVDILKNSNIEWISVRFEESSEFIKCNFKPTMKQKIKKWIHEKTK